MKILQDGLSPLWIAAYEGHFDAVKVLIDANADLDARDFVVILYNNRNNYFNNNNIMTLT